jgi:mono/diheme cytochrome c family protein
MQLNLINSYTAALLASAIGIFTAAAQPSSAVTSAPVYVPSYTHAGEPLPDGVIMWDALTKTADATNGQDFARFVFTFTNVAQKIDLGLATNITSITNLTSVTNSSLWAKFRGGKITHVASITRSTNTVTVTNSITPLPVTILAVHPSCGCTTAELPPVPWTIPGGSNGTIKVSVNLAGKSGTLFKSVAITTDNGKKDLMLRINVLPPPPPKPMSAEERAAGIAAAKLDRQAVFKGDCMNCHAKNVEGKYGQQLFAAVCAVCHEANPRATMVPDLHNLKDPTSEEFWRTWITTGKAGTLMPAFATSQGGPLNDMQIASLAAYLNYAMPSRVFPPQPTNVPAVK